MRTVFLTQDVPFPGSIHDFQGVKINAFNTLTPVNYPQVIQVTSKFYTRCLQAFHDPASCWTGVLCQEETILDPEYYSSNQILVNEILSIGIRIVIHTQIPWNCVYCDVY